MPEWKYTLKILPISRSYENSLTGKSDAVAGKLARLNEKMRDDGIWDEEFDDLIEDFSTFGDAPSDNKSYFETLMENLYDWADSARVWIEPRSRVK